MPAGNVTARNMEEIYPYRGEAVLLTLKGADVLAALEHGIDNPQIGQGRFSGIRLAVEPDLPEGEKIVDKLLPDGRKIDPNHDYKVLTNSYMANGGDGYTMFRNAISKRNFSTSMKGLMQLLVQQAGTINYTDDKRFSVGELRP